MAASKTLPLLLTAGAAHILLQLSSVPGLLTDENQALDFSDFRHDHLRGLPRPPVSPLKDVPITDEEIDKWADKELPAIQVTPETHQALKAAVKAALAKGMLGSGSPTRILGRELLRSKAKA